MTLLFVGETVARLESINYRARKKKMIRSKFPHRLHVRTAWRLYKSQIMSRAELNVLWLVLINRIVLDTPTEVC